MRAVIAMEQSVRPLDRASKPGRPSLVDRIAETLAICSRAREAAHAYEELKPLSDQALAARGLKRADLPRAAFDKLTEGS